MDLRDGINVLLLLMMLALWIVFIRQLRRPTGFIGSRMMGGFFNQGNATLNQLILETLDPGGDEQVLEIGFGGGQLLSDIAARLDRGLATGIDISEEMVERARSTLAGELAEGKVVVEQGDIAAIAREESSFDVVCSSNTLYFWEDPAAALSELHRVLRPGGRLILGYRPRSQLRWLPLIKHSFKLYSQEEIETMVRAAGFREIQITTGVTSSDRCLMATG